MSEEITSCNLRVKFNQGFACATDPANNTAINRDGKALTNLSSYWLHNLCPVCCHTFRLGDEVYIDEHKNVVHDSVLLPCKRNHEKALDVSEDASDFLVGLDAACPLKANIPIVRLDIDHQLLEAPHAGFQRHRCVVCSHTFRQNDHVVICPCSPREPKCKAAVHRDVIHGLNCLEAWHPVLNQQNFNEPIYCPITSRKLYG